MFPLLSGASISISSFVSLNILINCFLLYSYSIVNNFLLIDTSIFSSSVLFFSDSALSYILIIYLISSVVKLTLSVI